MSYSEILYNGKAHFEHLAKNVRRMNRFSQKVIIVSINLDALVWRIKDDLPNSPNFPTIWYLKLLL